MIKRLLILLLLAAFFVPVAWAASRTWTSSDGRFRTEAELLGFADGKVRLKKGDGKVIEVPLESLSAADRRFVKQRYPESAAPGETAGPKPPKPAPPKDDEEEAKPDDEPDDEADDPSESATHGPQEIEMKPLRLEPPKRKSRGKSASLAEYVLQLTRPQRIVQQGQGGGPAENEFRQAVNKEPNYVFQMPFRGVVKFGGRSYGFALDAVGAKAVGYDRLYFDVNGNGDLTDDHAVSAAEAAQTGPNLSQSQFPPVNVTFDADGEQVEHAFLLGVVCNMAGGKFQANASVYSALAREGFLAQGKKRTKIMLIDHNSNGRFDDAVAVNPNGSLAEGDLLLVNPNPRKATSGGPGADRSPVGKVVFVGKSFYRMSVPPDGAKLQLEPLRLGLGDVVCAGHAFRAVLASDDYGVVVIAGAKDQKIALAEGTWKVVNYTLDATGPGGK
ncbi:MAG: hypothetical protein GX594_11600, partial [Pirellulaceae bacterium]|nr:hypothetical protein [Pirellulaceae bacterium]